MDVFLLSNIDLIYVKTGVDAGLDADSIAPR